MLRSVLLTQPRRAFSALARSASRTALPAAAASTPASARLSPPAFTSGLLGACRCISARLRAAKGQGGKGQPRRPAERFEWRIFPRDIVGVNRGPELGKVGEVLRCMKKEGSVVVKGVNVIRVKVRDPDGDPEEPVRVWVEREAPIPYASVNLLDPVDKGRTRIRNRYLPTGEKVRIAVRSGAVIPRVPADPKPAPNRSPSPLCTTASDAHEVTYVPRGIATRREMQQAAAEGQAQGAAV
tara:strand:- start:703 stop:1422 length:720 start_codon:yes stop_codon:yes gene_type:complete